MKSLCGTPNNSIEAAKYSLPGSKKKWEQLASWFSLRDLGHVTACGCLQHPSQSTPGCQEISYSYLTSKLEPCLSCFQNNLLPGWVLEVCLKQNKTRQVPHLCAGLKPHCCLPCYASCRGWVAYKKSLLCIRFLPHLKQRSYGESGGWELLNGARSQLAVGTVRDSDACGCVSCPAQWLITAEYIYSNNYPLELSSFPKHFLRDCAWKPKQVWDSPTAKSSSR